MDPLSNTLSPASVAASASDTPRKLSPQAFEELFLSTYPRLVGLLRRMLGDSGRAEEIANEAFLKLYNTSLPPSVRANVAGWLYRTAMNLGIDDLRARTRHTQVAQDASRAISCSTQPEAGFEKCYLELFGEKD